MPAPFRGDAAAAAPSGTLGPVSGGVGRGVLDVCRGGGWLLAARSVLKRVAGGREIRPCGGAVPASWGCGAAAPVGGDRGLCKMSAPMLGSSAGSAVCQPSEPCRNAASVAGGPQATKFGWKYSRRSCGAPPSLLPLLAALPRPLPLSAPHGVGSDLLQNH